MSTDNFELFYIIKKENDPHQVVNSKTKGAIKVIEHAALVEAQTRNASIAADLGEKVDYFTSRLREIEAEKDSLREEIEALRKFIDEINEVDGTWIPTKANAIRDERESK